MSPIRLATLDDAARLQPLIQRCYRGEASRAGWTHEADLLEGERVSEAAVSSPEDRKSVV